MIKKKGIEEFFGVWDEETGNEIKEAIEEQRARGRKRAKERDKMFSK